MRTDLITDHGDHHVRWVGFGFILLLVFWLPFFGGRGAEVGSVCFKICSVSLHICTTIQSAAFMTNSCLVGAMLETQTDLNIFFPSWN